MMPPQHVLTEKNHAWFKQQIKDVRDLVRVSELYREAWKRQEQESLGHGVTQAVNECVDERLSILEEKVDQLMEQIIED